MIAELSLVRLDRNVFVDVRPGTAAANISDVDRYGCELTVRSAARN